MVSMLEPMFWIRAMEARLEPSPMPIMAMTAPTPTMMPSMVRKARILLREKANKASFRNSMKATTHPRLAPSALRAAEGRGNGAGLLDILHPHQDLDRKSVVSGKSVDLGGR